MVKKVPHAIVTCETCDKLQTECNQGGVTLRAGSDSENKIMTRWQVKNGTSGSDLPLLAMFEVREVMREGKIYVLDIKVWRWK